MKVQEEQNFKDFDQKLLDVTDQMKNSVKGHITRQETRLFMQNLEKYMLTKMTGFKEDMLERKAAASNAETEKKQAKAAAEQKVEKKGEKAKKKGEKKAEKAKKKAE